MRVASTQALPVTLLVMLVGVVMVGCRAAPSAFSAAPPAQVVMSRGGGLQGDLQTLTIASDGAYHLSGQKSVPRRGVLPAAERARIAALVAEVDWQAVQRNYMEPRGRDAYTYVVTVVAAGSGEARGTGATDVTLPQTPPAFAALVRHLDGLMNELAAGPVNMTAPRERPAGDAGAGSP